jgi:hypothetical protein
MASTTASGGRSGPFKAREGFDANKEKGVNFLRPDLPGSPNNPSGNGEVVQTEFFWDHANFIRWDGRQGTLPNPMADVIQSGEAYAIRMDFGGRDLGRIAVWDGNLSGSAKAALPAGSVFGVQLLDDITNPANLITDLDGFVLGIETNAIIGALGSYVLNSTGGSSAAIGVGGATGLVVPDGSALLWLGDTRIGQQGWAVVAGPNFEFVHTGAAAVGTTPGNWRFLNVQSWLKDLQADPDQPTDQQEGDFQTTAENQGKELKIWHNGAWQKIYSEVDVRAWIAALSLFEGTAQEVGGTVPNVLELTGLPDLTQNTQIDKIAHYWTWQGAPGYVIQAADPQGVGRDLPGTILNPGDWLQVANRSGDIANPDLRWTSVGGDLLAKSRGDNLYGLKVWAAGGWEVGSLVIHEKAIYRATGPVTATDPAPGLVGAPWAKIDLAAGVRWVTLDSDLPASAPAGEIYFVLQSAQAGGGGALYYWDGAANAWQPLGGSGGNAMDLTSGIPIVNVGVPVGTIQMWLVDNPPPGWLMLNGQTFNAANYPELAQVLGNTTLPDFRGAFLRGAGLNGNGSWGDAARAPGSWQEDSTARPKTAFNTDATGSHTHTYVSGNGSRSGIKGATWYGGEIGLYQTTNNSSSSGHHQHYIATGGDAETRPKNYAVHYIIKAADVAQRVRI